MIGKKRQELGMLQTIFLGEVSENEIWSIPAKTKNMISTDSDGINVIIVKKTYCITKPASCIFNLSRQNENIRVHSTFKNGG